MPKKSNIRQFSSYVKIRTKYKTEIRLLKNENGHSVTNDNGGEGPPVKHVLCNQQISVLFTKEDIKKKFENLKPVYEPLEIIFNK